MSSSGSSAEEIVAALQASSSEQELANVRKRLAPGEEAFGLRMREVFDIANANADLPRTELDRLLDHPAYEPRMVAMCILDFRARRRLDDDQRRELYDVYLDRHDRITTWDMVDRAAPRVVGGYLAGRSCAPLHELATAPEPLRRRTAITAPLQFVRAGDDDDLAEGFAIAARLVGDPDPTVHRPVGIFLKHAGTRDPDALHRFLTDHATTMPRPARRIAVEKLPPDERRRFLS